MGKLGHASNFTQGGGPKTANLMGDYACPDFSIERSTDRSLALVVVLFWQHAEKEIFIDSVSLVFVLVID